MFFTLAIISMLAYTTHNILIAKHARNMDGLSLGMYRNLSLIVVMAPVFLFVSYADLFQLPEVIYWIVLGSAAGAISLVLHFLAYQYLPVGIVGAFTKIRVLLLALWAYLFLGEYISVESLLMIILILAGVIFLGLQKNHMPHLNTKTEKGILLALGNALFVSIAIFFMSKAAREANPLMVAYFWEVFIGIFVLIIGIARQKFGIKRIQKIPIKKMKKIALISSLATVGTGAFALAIQYGAISIVAAVGASGMVFTAAISHVYHKENLNHYQWLGIIVVMIGIIGLKMFSQ